MQRLSLEVQSREAADEKRTPNGWRQAGFIPGILYGHGEPVSIVVNAKQFVQAIHGKAGANSLFDIKLGSNSNLTVIKEIQRDILSRKPIHVDFQRINIKEKLEVAVPIHTLGESTGVKNQQGVLQQVTRELKIKCLPDDIPASIDVDITNLELNHSIKVHDLAVPKGVEVLTPGENIVVTVGALKVEEEAPKVVTEAEAAAVQPEVIAKGKKEEEGAAPAAGAAAAPAAAEGDKKKAK